MSGLVGAVADILIGTAAVVALGAQLLRWLRVLQREHYLAGSVVHFYGRWARAERVPLPLVALATVAVFLLVGWALWATLAAAVFGLVFPLGLAVRGRTSALAWTRRLRTDAVVAVALIGAVVGGFAAAGWPWVGAAVALMAAPVAVDASAAVTKPVEDRIANRYVRRAQARLAAVRPTVVGITGSFGKTSTKHHLAELLAGRHGVVPSPRSFNNRAGLSRAVNEQLSDGTTVFIAEMGTYGPGEIRELCAWCPPDIAVVTAIGPVHLERMRTLDTIERAKREITELARTVVLSADDPRLSGWVDGLRATGKKVRTGGAVAPADVQVRLIGERWQLTVDERVVAIVPPVPGVRESNLAVAVATALELGVPIPEIVERLSRVTAVESRLVVATSPAGVMVIDDTFNANPVGAASALATLVALPINGRRVVVTPGIVELGPRQREENEALGRAAAQAGAELVIVGRTNVAALGAGFGEGAQRAATRDRAVAWVRAQLRAGDGVLYLNDLPDHYP